MYSVVSCYLVSLIVLFPRCFPLCCRYPSLSALFKPQTFSSSLPDCHVCKPFFPAFSPSDFLVWPVLCTHNSHSGFCSLFRFNPACFFDFWFWITHLFCHLSWLDFLLVSTLCLWQRFWFRLSLLILFTGKPTLFLDFHSVIRWPTMHRSVPVRTFIYLTERASWIKSDFSVHVWFRVSDFWQ